MSVPSELACRVSYILSRNCLGPRSQGEIPPETVYGPPVTESMVPVFTRVIPALQCYLEAITRMNGEHFVKSRHFWDDEEILKEAHRILKKHADSKRKVNIATHHVSSLVTFIEETKDRMFMPLIKVAH